MILTRADLIALSGRISARGVRRWLDAQRIPYLVGADGWPRVSQAVIAARLGEAAPAPRAPRLRLTISSSTTTSTGLGEAVPAPRAPR